MNYEALPDDLKDHGRFCAWRYEDRNGRQTKVPYHPLTGEAARSNDPGSFVSFSEAVQANGYDGIGIGIFNGLCAVDLDDCIFHYLGEDAVYHYSENLSMNLYLRQCNSLDFGDERMKKEGPILRDLIDKADAAIRTGEYCADLRFGHDYQLLAYAARLGVEGVGERLTAEQCRRNWFGFLYSPFAGNLQLIFYRGRKGDVLVKCYINEREARLIGLPGGPYYPWEDVKKMLMQYL